MTPTPHSITALVDRGDRACAQAQAADLAAAAHLLGPCFAEPIHVELERVARLAASDLGAATAAWAAVVAELARGSLIGPGLDRLPLAEAAAR